MQRATASGTDPGVLGEGAGLYLHVPFCSAVCPYCDFAVRVAKPGVRSNFARTLCAEIELLSDWPHLIETIYFGGGTPSLLAPEELERILDHARRVLPVAGEPRVFLEANPEDVRASSLLGHDNSGDFIYGASVVFVMYSGILFGTQTSGDIIDLVNNVKENNTCRLSAPKLR